MSVTVLGLYACSLDGYNTMAASDRTVLNPPANRSADDPALFLSALVDCSDDSIIGLDLDGHIRSWNRGAERIFGFSADEILGESLLRLVPADRVEEERRRLKEVRQGGVGRFEAVRLRKDGRSIEVSLTISPIKNIAGQIIGISCIQRDI